MAAGVQFHEDFHTTMLFFLYYTDEDSFKITASVGDHTDNSSHECITPTEITHPAPTPPPPAPLVPCLFDLRKSLLSVIHHAESLVAGHHRRIKSDNDLIFVGGQLSSRDERPRGRRRPRRLGRASRRAPILDRCTIRISDRRRLSGDVGG